MLGLSRCKHDSGELQTAIQRVQKIAKDGPSLRAVYVIASPRLPRSEGQCRLRSTPGKRRGCCRLADFRGDVPLKLRHSQFSVGARLLSGPPCLGDRDSAETKRKGTSRSLHDPEDCDDSTGIFRGLVSTRRKTPGSHFALELYTRHLLKMKVSSRRTARDEVCGSL